MSEATKDDDFESDEKDDVESDEENDDVESDEKRRQSNAATL